MRDEKTNRFLRYFPPLLRVLRDADPRPLPPAEARAAIKKIVEVPSADLTRLISGESQSIFENDVHWARFYLAKAGLLTSPQRGLWGLTPQGRKAELSSRDVSNLYDRVREANRSASTDEDSTPAPDVEAAATPSFWFAGAMWDTKDKLPEFLKEGVWINGHDDQKAKVRQMKAGDRIAIKASFVQKRDLPFDVHGEPVSCMRIKATGTITSNNGDGKTVEVRWDAPKKPRDWYFYTYRMTLIRADPDEEMARRLIDFTFGGAKQDYAWWLKQSYWVEKYGAATVPLPGGVSTDDSVATSPDDPPGPPTYGVADLREEGAFQSEAALEAMLASWELKKNLILQGPPGTGKTFLARRLGYALLGSNDPDLTRSRLRIVQFHPSLSYEDFVRGWRPKGKEGLDLVDGIFMEAITAARSEPDLKYVLVIEEINRGSPTQIFGEMLTLLEAGKRRHEEALELAYPRSPGERVFIPSNLYVIGTMNLADRSLALVDLALRRRFAFVTLEPMFGTEWRQWTEARGLAGDLCALISSKLGALNKVIAEVPSLGAQFRIGHSFVTPDAGERVADGRRWFRTKVETEIAPLLEEYWFDAPETARKWAAELLAGV